MFPRPEGQGEGEPDVANQNGRKDFASAARPAPRATPYELEFLLALVSTKIALLTELGAVQVMDG